MYYLKIWYEARNDAKLRSLTDAQHRTWFRLLCYAAEQPERGFIDSISKHLVAIEASGGDLDLLIETVTALQPLRVVTWCYTDENTVQIRFLNFEKRQGHVTASETPERVRERVAKHRRRKTSGNRGNDVTACNGDVTAGNDHVTACNGLELELELESESETHPPNVYAPPKADHTHHTRGGKVSGPLGEAIELLGSDPRTAPLAKHLGREHSKPALGDVEGWRWLRAARRIQEADIADSKRRSFPYLIAIARDLDASEREPKPKPARETKAQRQLREMREGFANRKWEDDDHGG